MSPQRKMGNTAPICAAIEETKTPAVSGPEKKKKKRLWDRLFPPSNVYSTKPPKTRVPLRKPQVLLKGCNTFEEHAIAKQEMLRKLQTLHGAEGLEAVGLRYQLLQDEFTSTLTPPKWLSSGSLPFCTKTRHGLFHGSERITSENRGLYICDGDVFDQIARCAQEYVHDWWIKKYGFEWHMIREHADEHKPHARPLRLLTSGNCVENAETPLLVIITGKGKVQAGMFSRLSLLTDSIESGSCEWDIQQALYQKWQVCLLDPNARGDSLALQAVSESLDVIAADRPLYVLSHSAAGGQLVRYWMNKPINVRACAFTDSTHNVQWVDQELKEFLQGPRCVYFKLHKHDDENVVCGEDAPCTEFWKHRFGDIRTRWAGTTEHALTNWYAHGPIWDFLLEWA